MAEILERAFNQTVGEFGLNELQTHLLKQILLRNLPRLNDGNFDLIRHFPPSSEQRIDGMTQLNNQINRFEILEYEKNELRYTKTIIFYYIVLAYLSRKTPF